MWCIRGSNLERFVKNASLRCIIILHSLCNIERVAIVLNFQICYKRMSQWNNCRLNLWKLYHHLQVVYISKVLSCVTVSHLSSFYCLRFIIITRFLSCSDKSFNNCILNTVFITIRTSTIEGLSVTILDKWIHARFGKY